MDQRPGRVLTQHDLYNALDWSQYPLSQDDTRENYSVRNTYLYNALFGEDDQARQESIQKLGPVYHEAMAVLEREGYEIGG